MNNDSLLLSGFGIYVLQRMFLLFCLYLICVGFLFNLYLFYVIK